MLALSAVPVAVLLVVFAALNHGLWRLIEFFLVSISRRIWQLLRCVLQDNTEFSSPGNILTNQVSPTPKQARGHTPPIQTEHGSQMSAKETRDHVTDAPVSKQEKTLNPRKTRNPSIFTMPKPRLGLGAL